MTTNMVVRSAAAYGQSAGYGGGATAALIGDPVQQVIGVIILLASMVLSGWSLWVRAKYGRPEGGS